MKGSLNFTQDDLTEKPFKAIDVDVIAKAIFNGKNLLDMKPEDRAREGLFLSFQGIPRLVRGGSKPLPPCLS